jgi:hypothetical protein
MIESIVELLFGFVLGALSLIVGSSIIGSIVAALRGVSRQSDCNREDANQVFGVVTEGTLPEGRTAISPTEAKLRSKSHYRKRRVQELCARRRH